MGVKMIKKYIWRPIIALLIFLLALMIFVQIFFSQSMVRLFGFQLYLVSYTGSMEPTLNYNDLVVIKNYDFDSLNKGDIITFVTKTTDGKMITITHTVNDIAYDTEGIRYIQTKGVNKSLPDSVPVTKDGREGTNKYIGKYAAKSEFLGNFIAFIKSPQGIVTIVINTLCGVLIYAVLKKEQKRTTES